MRTRNKAILWSLAAVVIVVAGLVGWVLRGTGDASAESAPDIEVGVPTIVDQQELEAFAGDHDPLYWAGERQNASIELTLTSKNAVFVRYLPEDAEAGDEGQYLTVATYGSIDGYDALSGADEDVADVSEAQDGAIIAVFDKRPKSTYFSFKNASFQTEVFSPKEGESKKLTDDGEIKLVGGTS